MLNKDEVYSMPGSVVTKTLRSYMKTFMIGIKHRESRCDCVDNYYVKALSVDGAYKVGMELIAGEGYLVETVTSPGEDAYGIDISCDCDDGMYNESIERSGAYPNGNVF